MPFISPKTTFGLAMPTRGGDPGILKVPSQLIYTQIYLMCEFNLKGGDRISWIGLHRHITDNSHIKAIGFPDHY